MWAILSVLVENKPGILFKVTHHFRSRNFNIDSISVGITDNSNYSKMTITTYGDEKQVEQFVGQVKENPELLLEQLGINPYEYYESRLLERIRAQQEEQQLSPEARELKELKKWRDDFESSQKQQQLAQQEAIIAKSLDDEFAATFAEMGITKPTVEMVADVAEQMLAEYKASKQRLPVKDALTRSKNSFQNRLAAWTEQNPEKFLELLPEKYAEKFVETYMAKKQGAKIPSLKTKTPPKSEKVSSNLEQFFKRGY